jgi:hypothetical protein
MTAEERKNIIKIQANLLKIKQTGKAPISITLYQNMGLIQVRNKKVILSNGNTEMRFDKLILTQKGQAILENTI